MIEISNGDMNLYGFIASLFASLAWPIFAVWLVLTFRSQLTQLFQKLSDFEGFGFRAKFGAAVEELARQAGAVAQEEPAVEENTAQPPNEPEASDGDEGSPAWPSLDGPWTFGDPEMMVLRAWRPIERAVRDGVLANGATTARSFDINLRRLRASSDISSSTVGLIRNARHLRDRVLQGHTSVTLSEAALYVTTAQQIANAIRAETQPPPPT